MGKTRSAPTLNDVAKAAGVSTATVSRCLNSPDRVIEATRQRVMQAVESLGYTPNFAARVMAAKRSFTIGAIIPTMDNAIFARGLQAFQDQLHENGYTLLVSSSAYDPEAEREQIRTLVARGADGLLLIGHARDAEIYEYLERHQIPSLVAWSYDPEAQRPSVGFRNTDAMCELARSVISAGHRRIAMISGMTQGNDRAQGRLQGVRQAMEEGGLDTSDLKVIETAYEIDKGAEAFAQLMDLTPRPTVVICGNDVLAAGAVHEARKLGIKVPEQVSVTGFDDIELAEIVSPALTTVHVPHREMGRKAACELTAMVEGKSEGRTICISTRLVTRDSLAMPPFLS
ncbi:MULTISPECIES: LacI family DNA-binding transcriptional regulator [unclassified Leisingera]|uniref:LacI family DNA-binding transcriptional regulator n=1 Tax=unclassified Leisingera TaxID=2614906 RepID=UPI0002D87D93|nr:MULTISPECIES: LacI family DNA-binding transcriptional regulator [unclassified Leisingera]KIC23611.1 LacI family transcriptional regulator [Leisingera sp. ANG-S3]KIC52182.1 LacI family transcriptional regulator [Leisingera sp. ANG-S]KID09740.1 LacI family transcriptional regulator [Leisingera sp. ANG1]